jgi:hypothetical protein
MRFTIVFTIALRLPADARNRRHETFRAAGPERSYVSSQESDQAEDDRNDQDDDADPQQEARDFHEDAEEQQDQTDYQQNYS